MKRLAGLSLAALLALIAGTVLWACGPFLPNVILGSDERMFNGPTGMFASELAHLDHLAKGDAPPPFMALPPPDDDPASQTLEADLAEVAEILASLGTPPDRRQAILDELAALRGGLYRTDSVNAGSVEGPAPDPATLKVPAGLPPELALYLEGAVAWHLGDLSEAEDAWNQVLGLPETQRRHRSTWAAFMLGRLAVDDHPEEATRRFQLTRELASKGFADSLGLAASSLGWEALAEIHQGHPDKALVLYQRQREAGDMTAFNSLSITSSNLLTSDEPEALDRVAHDPEARSLLTAYVISRASWDAERWLKALKAAGVQDQAGTDRLAWAAYLAGDFEQAAAWLDQAPESSPMARWIRARLLLRDGKLDEARELLAGVARDLPKTGMTLDEAFWFASGSEEVIAAPERAAGEEATLRLIQNDFIGAMDELLRAGYWMDAAYIAEQVLSADELKAYVDANAPAELAEKQEQPGETGEPGEDEWEPMLAGGYTSPPPERLARDLRYLLGRRLAREGRRSEAEVYLTGEPRAALESLSAHLSAGRDARRPRSGRAAELFDAACLLRYQGMEVTGTEVDPDWTLFEGSYDPSWYVGDRLERRKNQFIPMSPEEAARIEKNRTEPRRFHYRFRAADLAWEAAKLLPPGDRKAGMLATAGNWIKYAEPETADRFYKELVRCCGSTELGQQANELRWFPEADACSKGN